MILHEIVLGEDAHLASSSNGLKNQKESAIRFASLSRNSPIFTSAPNIRDVSDSKAPILQRTDSQRHNVPHPAPKRSAVPAPTTPPTTRNAAPVPAPTTPPTTRSRPSSLLAVDSIKGPSSAPNTPPAVRPSKTLSGAIAEGVKKEAKQHLILDHVSAWDIVSVQTGKNVPHRGRVMPPTVCFKFIVDIRDLSTWLFLCFLSNICDRS